MQINPYLFMLPRTPGQIVWDYRNHKQFELNLEYSTRLAQLIDNPRAFDTNNIIDTQFLNTGILITSTQRAIEWGWDELSKIFHIGTKNIPCEYTPKNIHEWSRHYLDHCNEVLASSGSGADNSRHATGKLIALPIPARLPESYLADALMNRKTCRSFTGDAITLDHLSTLLYLTPAVTALWAALMFGQPVRPTTVAGLLVSAGAVALFLRTPTGRRSRLRRLRPR